MLSTVGKDKHSTLNNSDTKTFVFVAVTWGLNLFDPYVYADVPRTVADATADDWTLLSSCGGNTIKMFQNVPQISVYLRWID